MRRRKSGLARSLAALRAYNRTATRAQRARAARKGWKGHKARARSAAAVKGAATRRARAVAAGAGPSVVIEGGAERRLEAEEIYDDEYFANEIEGDEEVYTGEGE